MYSPFFPFLNGVFLTVSQGEDADTASGGDEGGRTGGAASAQTADDMTSFMERSANSPEIWVTLMYSRTHFHDQLYELYKPSCPIRANENEDA